MVVPSAVSGPQGRERAERVLRTVMDPEIPVLSLHDLGVIRSLEVDGNRVRVGVTPTYSGCPATEVIRGALVAALRAGGFDAVEVFDVLRPAWSSADLTPEGRATLESYGIAPPQEPVHSTRALAGGGSPRRCPRCHGTDVECLSEFGSTPCKALYRCRGCHEPFDYFKCL